MSLKSVSQVPIWFERKFDFTFPVDHFPNLCARLRGTPARLEEILHGSSDKVLRRKLDGKWSAQEHAGHLMDLESLWSARVSDFLAGGTELTTADLKNRKTHEANHNGRPLQQILGEFRKVRMELLSRLGQNDPALYGRTMLHPRLQTPMRLVDHLFFVAEHDDHHLAHIWEMVRDRAQ